jgi:hypothetical protein
VCVSCAPCAASDIEPSVRPPPLKKERRTAGTRLGSQPASHQPAPRSLPRATPPTGRSALATPPRKRSKISEKRRTPGTHGDDAQWFCVPLGAGGDFTSPPPPTRLRPPTRAHINPYRRLACGLHKQASPSPTTQLPKSTAFPPPRRRPVAVVASRLVLGLLYRERAARGLSAARNRGGNTHAQRDQVPSKRQCRQGEWS